MEIKNCQRSRRGWRGYKVFIVWKDYIGLFVSAATEEKKSDETEKKTDEDVAVEDDKEEEKKKKTKTVDKTVWEWELMNESKPIWQRK